jgi:hypothetical protein
MSGHSPGEQTAQPTPSILNHVEAVNGTPADPLLSVSHLIVEGDLLEGSRRR